MDDRDVVVVGAGLAGSTAALFAARHGSSTLVVDAGLVPGGQMDFRRRTPLLLRGPERHDDAS